MRTLPTPRRVPADHPRYLRHDLGKDRGVVVFRIPRPTKAAQLFALWHERVGGMAVSNDGAFSAMTSEEVTGFLIGTCWYHPTQTLETQRGTYAATEAGALEYGDAVLEELEEAGFTSEDFGAFGGVIVAGLMRSIQVSASAPEVAAEADAFPRFAARA